jgi:hypothetical protein
VEGKAASNSFPTSNTLSFFGLIAVHPILGCDHSSSARKTVQLYRLMGQPLEAIWRERILYLASSWFGRVVFRCFRIRRTGISVDNEERTKGISALGAPSIEPMGRALAVAIPVPTGLNALEQLGAIGHGLGRKLW